MSSPVLLRGITWNHTRGYLPLVAATQRFHEIHAGAVDIVWEKRSLREFEATPVDELAARYDLLVIDHPFVGYASATGALLPLDLHLDGAFLADQAAHSVGGSHESYLWAGHQWALAVDAATPVACYRPDLVQKLGLNMPRTWEDLLELGRAGHVELPAAPINCLMNFYALCVSHGEAPALGRERLVSAAVGEAALADLAALVAASAPGGHARNPIQSYEALLQPDNERVAYIPLTYGYSNYSRPGYAARLLAFGDVVSHRGAPLRTTLGGTGLALSARTPHRDRALEFARYAASGEIQRTLFTAAGGQPGHRSAWTDPAGDRAANGYFSATLPALDRAWLRPRHDGYMHFQDLAGDLVHAAVSGRAAFAPTLAEIDRLWSASFPVA
jgi:multiple sugar transport system substrate-binding protein